MAEQIIYLRSRYTYHASPPMSTISTALNPGCSAALACIPLPVTPLMHRISWFLVLVKTTRGRSVSGVRPRSFPYIFPQPRLFHSLFHPKGLLIHALASYLSPVFDLCMVSHRHRNPQTHIEFPGPILRYIPGSSRTLSIGRLPTRLKDPEPSQQQPGSLSSEVPSRNENGSLVTSLLNAWLPCQSGRAAVDLSHLNCKCNGTGSLPWVPPGLLPQYIQGESGLGETRNTYIMSSD